MDDRPIDAACRMIADARAIGVYGCGREALQIKGFAMRLFHLGLPVSVVGDMTMPPLGRGDVFLVRFRSRRNLDGAGLIRGARGRRDESAVDRPAREQRGKAADFTLVIPAQTMANDQGARRPRSCRWVRCTKARCSCCSR